MRLWNDALEGRGFSVEVSRTGMLIETTHPVDTGVRIHLEIELPDGSSYFTEAVIVRRRAYPRHAHAMFKPTIGVRFLGLDEMIDSDDFVDSIEPDTLVVPVDARTRALQDPLSALSEHEKVDLGPLPVDLTDPEVLETAYERDVKHGGVRVPTSHRPPVDSAVTLTLMLPEPHPPIECTGVVVTHAADLPEIGVLLDDVDALRARLLAVIREG